MRQGNIPGPVEFARALLSGAPPRRLLAEAAAALRTLLSARAVSIEVAAPGESAVAGAAPPDAPRDSAPLRAGGRPLGRLMVCPGEVAVAPEALAAAADAIGEALARARADEAGRSEAERALSEVAHELRTPLTAIRSFAEVLLAETPPDAPTREYAAVIHEEAVRLSRLVARLLDLSRLRAGRVAFEFAQDDLAAAARTAALTVAPAAALKSVRIAERFAPDLAPLRFDRDRIVQVFVNLLANAVRHSPEGGEIVLSLRMRDGGAEAAVADAGPGIPPADREAVFSGRPGGGLGLAISRDIVRAHGGAIRAGEAPGGGALLSFTIPGNPPPPAAPPGPERA